MRVQIILILLNFALLTYMLRVYERRAKIVHNLKQLTTFS